MKKILIIRRDNIGDLICTTPLIEAIRRHYPDAYVAALVNSYNAPALDGNPHLNDVFTYTKAKHSAETPVWRSHLHRVGLIWRLRRMRFDYVILATSSFAARALKFARLLAPREIIGFVTAQASSPAITCPIPASASEIHETEDIFRLLEPLSIVGNIPGLTLRADARISARIAAGLPAEVASGNGPLIALHISARKEKQRWPAANFAELARRLNARYGARFLLFWSPGAEDNPFHPGDDGKAAELLTQLSGLPIAGVPTGQLSELIAGLSLSDQAILSDGGAMHVAAGLGKPLVCFFGNSSATRWHPWGVPFQLLQPASRNVADITVDEACAAYEALLGVVA